MGFFSWLTSDTGESIMNVHSGEARTVYLLQPNGEPPIREDAYAGYGQFGGVRAYEWLARRNLTPEQLARVGEDPDELYTVGLRLAVGTWYEDAFTGAKLSVFHDGFDLIDPEIVHHPVTYSEPLPGYDGKSANDLIAAGHLLKRQFEVAHPLKFSFDPNARYEDLPAAQDCPRQGFFEPEEDEDAEG